ncbi:phage tail protein [Hydrogenophaga sp.]|uniref:phage tail protein n=1 Tax=Hydrogenophaga sp. TaxID=1904254 RepID=UPI0025C098D5|nr:phage tail protein [Hydrogenophaga sp.]
MPGTVVPRELVLGRVRKGGHVFFRGSVGVNREKFVMLVALAGHEIDGVEQIWLNDVAVTLDGGGYVQTAPYLLTRTESGSVLGTVAPPEAIPGTIQTLSYDTGDSGSEIRTVYQYYVNTPKARIRAYLGAPGQTADAQVIADFPTLWTADHRADGIAYLVCEFFYDETAFPSGLPLVTATIRGAKCYDPRSGLTVFTENPALMQRHILTHPYFGKRASISTAEDAQIVAAANACDTAIDYGQGNVPMYRASIVLPFGGAARDGLDDLAQAMAGQWAYAAGEFFTRAGVYTAPVLSLTDADLAVVKRSGDGSTTQQGIGISTHRARAEKFNVITPRIFDAAQDYKQVPVAPVKAAALIARDGAELVQEVDMPAVFYAQQAQHVAGVAMRDSRDPLTVVLPFKLAAYRAELFDTVSLTIPRYGWAGKEFMVVQRQWTLEGLIQLTLKETTAAIYQPDAAFVASGYAQNTALTRPWDIQPPTITGIESGTDLLMRQSDGTIVARVQVSWAPITDQTLIFGGTVEVQWASIGAVLSWQTVTASPIDQQVRIVGAPDGAAILVRARTRNSLAVSDWSVQQSHTVIGKTEPPPAFDAFVVLAQPDGTRQFNFAYVETTKPVDWAGAEIRYIAGNNPGAAWETLTPLQDADTFYTASPVELNAPLAGEWTFFCRSRDTTGNLSPALVDNITLPARRTGDVFDEFFEGPLWAGTKTGCQVLDGVLEAIDSTTWATAPATWDGWSRWNLSPASPISYIVTKDLGTTVAGSIDASIDADGTELLELATSADGTTWSAYGSGAASFSSRYIRVRLTVTATGGEPVPVIRRFDWQVNASLQFEYINSVDISTLTGDRRIAAGDVRVPIGNVYTFIKRVDITIEDSSAGSWTHQRIDNLATGPRFQFKLDGALTDPAGVDFYVEGI